jgi:hypothetical protein
LAVTLNQNVVLWIIINYMSVMAYL